MEPVIWVNLDLLFKIFMFPDLEIISFIIYQNDIGFCAELMSYLDVDNSVESVERLSKYRI